MDHSRPAPRSDAEQLLTEYRRTGDRSLRNRVIEEHMGMVSFQVRRFTRGSSAPAEDLRQTALMAVVNAAERFDPTNGASFKTFASRTVEGELKRYLRDRSWAVRPPRARQEAHLAASRATEELTQQLGRAPTVDEIAQRAGMDREQVLEAMETALARVAEPVENDDHHGSGGGHASTLGRVDASFEAAESHMDLRAALTGLDPRQRQVVQLRFIEERSQPEIAAEMGISQSYVSRLLRNAMSQLRGVMDAAQDDEPFAAAHDVRSTVLAGLRIEWGRDVLEPRPWTLAQADWAVELDPDLPEGPVVELCTGSGYVGLTVLERTGRCGILVDSDGKACEFAERNARTAGLDGRAEILCERIDGAPLKGWQGTASLVLADPAHVRSDEAVRHPSDASHAIDGGPDGLAQVRPVLGTAARIMAPGGSCLLQVRGADQASSIRRALGGPWAAFGVECVEVREHGPERAIIRLDRKGGSADNG
jgi:RNA polymerase sigma-B factor